MLSAVVQLVLLVGVHAVAKPVTESGKTWDPRDLGAEAAPDLGIAVFVDGHAVGRCDGPEDAVDAECTLAYPVELDDDSATTIELRVVDRDVLRDDPIGTATATGPWESGRGAISLEVEGQLVSATVLVEDSPSTEHWFLWRVLAGLLGGGAAAALVFALRHRMVPPRREEVPEVIEHPDGPATVVMRRVPGTDESLRVDHAIYAAATAAAVVALYTYFRAAAYAPASSYAFGAFAAVCALASIVAGQLRGRGDD